LRLALARAPAKRKGIVQETGDAFRTGSYHRSFRGKHSPRVRGIQLRWFYTTSARLLKLLGWPDPLGAATPRVLLCGSGSPSTTIAFARFVSRRNPAAQIDVLDLSAYSLRQSALALQSCRDLDAAHVSFVEADARRMPFAAESFDGIETDFLIQFFSPEERTLLFREWYRVLKPGGVVTTRDWLSQRHNLVERVVIATKNWTIRRILGASAHGLSVHEVQSELASQGFESAVFPMRIPGIQLSVPTMKYLLIHKPALRR
jgi:SAM-dependent methyltransferase